MQVVIVPKSLLEKNSSTNKTDATAVVFNTKNSLCLQPSCIKELIEKMKSKPVTNPPNKVFKIYVKQQNSILCASSLL